MEINLQNLNAATGSKGILLSFMPIQDPSMCYLLYLERKYIQQQDPQELEGKSGLWSQALGWFNPAGRAFWDERQTSIGPTIQCFVNMLNNALIADGSKYQACVAIYKKIRTGETSGSMELVGYSQNFIVTAPNLYPTPSQDTTTSTPVSPTPTTEPVTTTTVKPGKGGKK